MKNIKQQKIHTQKESHHLYRLMIINEESLKEAFSIQLTRRKVFIALASLFIALFLIFSILIFFTPLKYYVPGNNSGEVSRQQLIKMQRMADSLQQMNEIQEKYILNVMQVANGTVSKQLDNTLLNDNTIKQADAQNANKIDRASRYEYLKNQKPDTNVDNSVQKKDSIK